MTEPGTAPGTPPGWLPAARNGGHAYRDRVDRAWPSVVGYYAAHYGHSAASIWRQRLAAGEIQCNGQRLRADGPLAAGDQLVWHRPPWWEAAVPALHQGAIVFDDGDLLVLDKPSGLPVLPAGGFLRHTLLAQLEALVAGAPLPVHRLGRFTSGLLVCARRPATRAWLSAQLRDSTRADPAASAGPVPCRKLYRALTTPLPDPWTPGSTETVAWPIGRRPHPLLGEIWCGLSPGQGDGLPAHSRFTLLQRRPESCLVEVAIATGRPHQIRIHAACLGAPLLGDPLYGSGGEARPDALPGAGGYWLHAHRLELLRPDGCRLELEAPPPRELQQPLDQPRSKASSREK
ncbi:MAG: RluA family pseudouridine synthase [Vulcanococcus sp.]